MRCVLVGEEDGGGGGMFVRAEDMARRTSITNLATIAFTNFCALFEIHDKSHQYIHSHKHMCIDNMLNYEWYESYLSNQIHIIKIRNNFIPLDVLNAPPTNVYML